MRRAKKDQIDSIVFDDHARLEFLTGFRKRKLLKKEASKSKAKERERQERLQARKEQRQALKERAEENARMIEYACRQMVSSGGSEEEAFGLSAPDKGKGKATKKFEDEEQLATVTIVHEFDPEALRHGTSLPSSAKAMPSQIGSLSDHRQSNSKSLQSESESDDSHDDSFATRDNKANLVKPKPHREKVAYETKVAWKAARIGQRARKLEKAGPARNAVRRKGEKRVRKVKR